MATVLGATTVSTVLMVLDTAMDSTTARGRLRLSPRLMPTTDTDTALVAITVATGPTVSDTATVSTDTARGRLSPITVSTLLITLSPLWSPATPRSPPLPPSPPSALPLPPSPLLEEPTLVPDATSPTPPEPSMLPRGRLRPTPTTTEDTVSDTGPTEDTEDTASDTAVATTGVRFCLDVLDLDATMLPTFCPWIGPRRI